MKSNLKILCTICARGGSKGVKNKNLRHILGKPLIAHTIEQAFKANIFSKIVVSTDSKAIGEAAKTFGADYIIERPESLARDAAPKVPAIRHALVESERHYGKEYDLVVDLDATSPLRNSDDIVQATNTCISNDFDNVITAAPARRSPYFNLIEENSSGHVVLSKNLPESIFRRQDVPRCFDMNASIYVWKRKVLLEQDKLFLEKTGLYEMPEERSLDIDSELDFKLVEFLMKRNDMPL
jgi:CMP-N,N'-diacetyllegionaminic acid synthase